MFSARSRQLCLVGTLILASAYAQADHPRLYQGVTATPDAIVFSYAGSLWLVPHEGGEATPLTKDKTEDAWPVASPDGQRIAFARERGGNMDVFTIDSAGGEPTRITYHPKPDAPRSWSADGGSVVFASQRDGDMQPGLYKIAAQGGFPERLPLPMGYDGVLSADGAQLIYNPVSWAHEYNVYRHYRGGMSSPLWLTTLDGGDTEVLRDNSVNQNDPIWMGDKLYFRSDEDGVFNIFEMDLTSREVTQRTDFDSFGVDSLGSGGDALVFTRAGFIYRLDLATNELTQLAVDIPVSSGSSRSGEVDASEWLMDADIAPSGQRLALEARGDIFVYDVSTKESRNLTASSGAADRSPVWSPDGTAVAWFSDQGGEYALHIQQIDTDATARRISIEERPAFYRQPVWSPNGRYIAFTGKRLDLWLADLESGTTAQIEQSDYLAQETYNPSWSPNGRYIAYSKGLPNHTRNVVVYDTESKEKHTLDAGASADFPVFDRGGQYLYSTVSNTSHLSAPLDVWGVLSGALYAPMVSQRLACAILHADGVAPGADRQASAAGMGAIDFEGLSERLVGIAAPRKNFTGLAAGPGGQLLATFRKWPDTPGAGDPIQSVMRIAIGDRARLNELPGGADKISVTPDGKIALLRQGDNLSLLAMDSEGSSEPERIAIEGLPMTVDREAEWKQMFHEAWRLMRDYFYDENHHGQDLKALEAHYAAYLPSITRREDLTLLFREMLGQVSISHMAIGGGDVGSQPGILRDTGVLGAEFEIVDGHYRVAKIHRRGSPAALNSLLADAALDQPGVDVAEGDFILAVDGKALDGSQNIYAALNRTAGKEISLTVADSPDSASPRTVSVTPMIGDNSLIRNTWFEENRKRVAEMSDGRVGYVAMPSFSYGSIEEFLYQAAAAQNAEAVIIDQRFNGGGTTSDTLLLNLLAPRLHHYDFPYGEDLVVPATLQDMPKVLIVNEMNFSAAETFPLMFQITGAGTIVGKRTGGGGTGGALHYPRLVDGGYVIIPNRASYNPKTGEWAENSGVAPDVEVEWWPSDWQQGTDPQLERAVSIAMEQLKSRKPETLTRPEYPVHPGAYQP